jgi:hypothetical protein
MCVTRGETIEQEPALLSSSVKPKHQVPGNCMHTDRLHQNRPTLTSIAMEFQEPILNEWKHHSEEEMIPNVLNMTQMAHHPPIGSTAVPTKAIIYGTLLVVTW